MSDETKFDPSFVGIGRLLRSDMIAEALMARADAVKQRAEELAPVSDDPNNPHAGRYKDSFHTRLGMKRARVEAVVYNDAPEAIYVEKGTSVQEGRNVLMRALDILRATGGRP